MLQSIKNLGRTLEKKELLEITGGKREAILSDGGFGCEDGTFACFCNFHLVGCYTSTGACEASCNHHF